MSTLVFFQGGFTHTTTLMPHYEVVARRECATCLRSHSRTQSLSGATNASAWSSARSCAPHRPACPADNCRPSPASSGSGVGAAPGALTQPHHHRILQAAAAALQTHQPHALLRQRREDTSAPREAPPLPPAAFVALGAGPLRGGARRRGQGLPGRWVPTSSRRALSLRSVTLRLPRPKGTGASLQPPRFAPGHAVSQLHLLSQLLETLRPNLHYRPFNPRKGGEASIQQALLFIAHSSLNLQASKAESIPPKNVAICGYLCILRVASAILRPVF